MPKWWREVVTDARANEEAMSILANRRRDPTIVVESRGSRARLMPPSRRRIRPSLIAAETIRSSCPEELLDRSDDGGLRCSICCCFTAGRVFVAVHSEVGYPHDVACIDRKTNKLVWKEKACGCWWGDATGQHESWCRFSRRMADEYSCLALRPRAFTLKDSIRRMGKQRSALQITTDAMMRRFKVVEPNRLSHYWLQHGCACNVEQDEVARAGSGHGDGRISSAGGPGADGRWTARCRGAERRCRDRRTRAASAHPGRVAQSVAVGGGDCARDRCHRLSRRTHSFTAPCCDTSFPPMRSLVSASVCCLPTESWRRLSCSGSTHCTIWWR